jgi:hypothetical protein
MKPEPQRANCRWIGLMLVVGALCLPWQAAAEGTWIALQNQSPEGIGTMLLLSDGTVMAQGGGGGFASANWYRLSPTNSTGRSTGGYTNGTWTTRETANSSRLYYTSVVLPNGKVFIAGAEVGNGSATAETYDPVTDHWTPIYVPLNFLNLSLGAFYDCGGIVLSNGKVLIAPVYPLPAGLTLIYDPVANNWSTAQLVRGGSEDEATFVKLPDDSILVNDFNTQNSERFVPSSQTWIDDTNSFLPVNLYDQIGFETGPALLLPNSNVLYIGSSPFTAIYTPSGNNTPGAWVLGPPVPTPPGVPGGLGAPDAPAAMMVNGKILCALSPTPYAGNKFPTPTYFYEYDYTTGPLGTFTQIHAPGPGGNYTYNDVTWKDRMLVLPDGTVLFCNGTSQLYVYQPDTSTPILAAGRPAIHGITRNPDGSYHLVGTGLNGISQGASYGDDAQMDSNYPLVRMTYTNGYVFYATTYNWSSTSIMTGDTPVTTEFSVPPDLLPGPYVLEVVVNGISSNPVTFDGPVWVDFTSDFLFQFGVYEFPYSTLVQGTNAVAPGGTIAIKGQSINFQSIPAVSHNHPTISKPMTITALGGPATIGQ